jgi:hypothetical protein
LIELIAARLGRDQVFRLAIDVLKLGIPDLAKRFQKSELFNPHRINFGCPYRAPNPDQVCEYSRRDGRWYQEQFGIILKQSIGNLNQCPETL